MASEASGCPKPGSGPVRSLGGFKKRLPAESFPVLRAVLGQKSRAGNKVAAARMGLTKEGVAAAGAAPRSLPAPLSAAPL